MSSLSKSQWRRIAVAGYGPTLVSSIGFGCVNPLIAYSASARGATLGQAAFIVGLLSLGGWLGSIPAGILATTIGEKRAIVAACLTDSVLFLVVYAARTLPILAIATFCCGLTSSIFNLARQSFLTEAVPIHVRGRALSTLGGTFRVGFLIGPLVGALVTTHYGLPAAYAFAAVMSLMAALITLAIPDIEHEADRVQHDPDAAKLGAVIRSGFTSLITIGMGAMAIAAIRSSRQTLIPLWCKATHLAPQTTSLIVAASMAFDVLLFFPGGMLMDRIGRFWLSVPSMIAMSTALLVLPLAHTRMTILLVAIALGISNGLTSGILMTLAADASPAVGRAKFLAAFRMLTGTGDAGSPLLISLIVSAFPLAAAAITMGVIGYLGAGWLSLWLPRTRAPKVAKQA
ncbi:MAG: MFS transporter [Propionibacteriaceae bacterium]